MNLHFGMDVEGLIEAGGAAAPEGDKDAEADELSKLAST